MVEVFIETLTVGEKCLYIRIVDIRSNEGSQVDVREFYFVAEHACYDEELSSDIDATEIIIWVRFGVAIFMSFSYDLREAFFSLFKCGEDIPERTRENSLYASHHITYRDTILQKWYHTRTCHDGRITGVSASIGDKLVKHGALVEAERILVGSHDSVWRMAHDMQMDIFECVFGSGSIDDDSSLVFTYLQSRLDITCS